MASASSTDICADIQDSSSLLPVSHGEDFTRGENSGDAAVVTSHEALNGEGTRGGDSAASSQDGSLSEAVQQINLTGDDCEEGVPVHSKIVKIVASTKTALSNYGGAENQCASGLVTINSIATQVWDPGYYNGKLISGNKTFVAYAVKGRSGYVIRVINLSTQARILIHGPYEGIADLAFAHSNSNVLACVDTKGNLFVWQLADGAAVDYSVMLIVNAPESSDVENSVQRVIWCPHIVSASTSGDEIATPFLVVVRGRTAEVLDLELAASAQVDEEPISHEALKHGVAVVTDGHEQGLLDAALSPDAAVLATASLDGHVKFWQIDQTNVNGPPHCLHDWSPHDGAPVSSIVFCDNRTEHKPEHSFWRFVITGSDRNRVLRIWCTVTWSCLQTISFEPSLAEGGLSKATVPALQVALDDSASYLILSDVHRKVLYVAHIHQQVEEGKAFIERVNEYVLSQPLLSFSIVDLISCSNNMHPVTDDLTSTRDRSREKKRGIALKLCCIQPKAIQELTVSIGSSEDTATSAYAACNPLATPSDISTITTLADSVQLVSQTSLSALQANSPLHSSAADELEASLATVLSSSLNLSTSVTSVVPTGSSMELPTSSAGSSLLFTEMLNGMQDRSGSALDSSTTLLTPAAFSSDMDSSLSGDVSSSLLKSPTSSQMPFLSSSTSATPSRMALLQDAQVSPGCLPPLVPLGTPSLRPVTPLMDVLQPSQPMSLGSLPPLGSVSGVPVSNDLLGSRPGPESEMPVPSLSQDVMQQSPLSMMNVAVAPAEGSSSFELKSTEGKGDSGLESDQDVIVIAEEEQDEEEGETDEVAEESNEAGQTAEAAADDDIRTAQLEAVLDEALRQAAVQQNLPGTRDVDTESAKKEETSHTDPDDSLDRSEQMTSVSSPSVLIQLPAEDSHSESAGSDTGTGRGGMESGGDMASEPGPDGHPVTALSTERPHRRKRGNRRTKRQHGASDSRSRSEDTPSDLTKGSQSTADFELEEGSDLRAMLREQQKELAQLRHLLHQQQSQMQAAVRTVIEAESHRNASQHQQQMQSMAQHCVREEQHHIEKLLKDRQSAEKSRNERLQNALSTTLVQAVGAKVDKSVKAELKASIIPAFNNSMSNITRQMRELLAGQETAIAGWLTNAMRTKPITDALGNSLITVASSSDSALKRVWRQTFDTIFLPGVERSMSAMFNQVNTALHHATQEYVQQMEAVRRHADDKVLPLLQQRLAQVAEKQEGLSKEVAQTVSSILQRCVEETVSGQFSRLRDAVVDGVKSEMLSAMQQQAMLIQQQQNQIMQQVSQQVSQSLGQQIPQFLQQLTATMQQQHQQASQQQQQILTALSQTQQEVRQQLAMFQSRAPGPMASNGVPALTEKQQREARIHQLIRQNNFQQAFHEALSASDLEHVLTVCKSVRSEELFGTPPCPLNQQILLSLVQQLSSELTTDVDLKVRFLQGALSNLNSADTVTRKFGPAVMQRLCSSIDELPSSANSGAFGLLKMAAQTIERYAQQT